MFNHVQIEIPIITSSSKNQFHTRTLSDLKGGLRRSIALKEKLLEFYENDFEMYKRTFHQSAPAHNILNASTTEEEWSCPILLFEGRKLFLSMNEICSIRIYSHAGIIVESLLGINRVLEFSVLICSTGRELDRLYLDQEKTESLWENISKDESITKVDLREYLVTKLEVRCVNDMDHIRSTNLAELALNFPIEDQETLVVKCNNGEMNVLKSMSLASYRTNFVF
jgi:hypothetical protein